MLSKRILDASKPTDPAGAILEAWAQGFLVGSLIVMICVTMANMRKHVLLHKLILIELLLGLLHGTFILTNPPVYNWYLSTTAILLNASWSLHNVIAWMKTRPFLSKRASWLYIGTVILVQPYWVLEIAANFLYFDNKSNLFVHTRPWEALCRDPWWIFTILNLFYNIKTRYELGYVQIIRVSPRFGILLGAMVLSMIFILLDILAVTKVINSRGLPNGINPFWKLAFVFKCLTDTIILDDFKTALDRLKDYKLDRIASIGTADGTGRDFGTVNLGANKRDDRLPPSRQQAVERPSDSVTLDWSKISDAEHIDLEAAPRTFVKEHRGQSSESCGG